MIAVNDLRAFYGRGRGRRAVLQGVSFSVGQGEAFGLVGESGSGKSTVLKAIAGLVEDWEGGIGIAGEALGQRRTRHFRRRVQMVFQDPYGSLHPRHTVARIVGEPLAIHGFGTRAERMERVGHVLESVGLDWRYRYRFAHQLSGGQRQRVAIARALVLEPDLILLDEPTSALDVSVQAEILNLLRRLQDERGLTYLFVSHDLAVVAHLCRRIAVMSEGRVVEELSRDELARGRARMAYTRALLDAAAYRRSPRLP